MKKRKSWRLSPAVEEAGSSSSLQSQQLCRHFAFADIQVATRNFDETLVIGHGGFGKVYKGTVTNGASRVVAAIKRLDSTSNQGAIEFWAEVEMLSKLRHCHLVSLLGHCKEGQEMILVYEYMSYGTLADHLHKLHTPLSWIRRLKICIGAARGLDYLHTAGINHGVIHRDVKSSNILLEKSWAAKISDFGLSKVAPTNQPSTYVNTAVRGTFGYLDPHYYSTGRLTRKSDTYAFGVVLFEVLCGKHAVDDSLDEEQWNLAIWAQDSIKGGRLKQIIDPDVSEEISAKCLKEFARLAERCLHSHPKQRPTMAEVVVGLELVLALQEKNKSLHTAGITILGRKVPMILFPSNAENSGRDRSLESLDCNFCTDGGESVELLQFKFDVIRVATENFSEANRHQGLGIDFIYSGRLQNGQRITIKKFYSESPIFFASPTFRKECTKEVSLLLKLEHENLIQLLGYCLEGSTMFLIYDFAIYASLHCFISGVARGLCYLHKHAPILVVHNDVKPGNILLDESLDPKISNFALARSFPRDDRDHDDSSVIAGTFEYLVPEHTLKGHLSAKSDVFSFGLLVLETIGGTSTSRKFLPESSEGFIRHVWKNWSEETFSNIIDRSIVIDPSSMTRYIQIGLLCIQHKAVERPTMDEVVEMLMGGSSLILPIPKMREDWYSETLNDAYNSGAVQIAWSEMLYDHDSGPDEESMS